jgi:L-galactose dehydrogenase
VWCSPPSAAGWGQTEFDFSRTRIRSGLEASLRRLHTEFVDLLQAHDHDIEFGSEQQIVEETTPALRELQQEAKARLIGITGYSVRLLRRIAEQAPVDTILSYCHYSLLNTDMKTVLAPLTDAPGTALINASPLMMGMLTQGGPTDWHVAPEQMKEAGDSPANQYYDHGGTDPPPINREEESAIHSLHDFGPDLTSILALIS